MNKSLTCLAFCALSSYAMQNPFGDALKHENVVGAAVSDLFSGPLPTVTRSPLPEASAEQKEFAEMAGAFSAFEISQTESEKARSYSVRRLISLNEAIRFGKFNTLENNEKGNILVFEDFETLPTAPRPPFSMTLNDVNTHIYTAQLQYKTTPPLTYLEDTRKVRSKIFAEPQASLTENEFLAYQSPLILAFLTHADIRGPKQELLQKVQNDNDKSNNQKKAVCAQIEKQSTDASESRILYLAALATQNLSAINQQRTTSFQSPFITSATLVEEITHLREMARSQRSPLGALFNHMNCPHGATIIDPDDCTIS